jgi:type IV pilus assembly protein PilM
MGNMLFYQDKPIFGLDVGFSSVKVMQIEHNKRHVDIIGYGTTRFDNSAITDGIVTNPELIAKDIKTLFEQNLVGKITTRRVVLSVPGARTFIRSIKLPKLEQKDLEEAIRLETEEYTPLPIEDLYVDYSVTSVGEKDQDILVVAAPRKLVDSYVALSEMLGLETVAVETTTNGGCRLFAHADVNKTPTVLVDLGSQSSDITVYDGGIVVTSTVPGGGDSFSEKIANKLGVTHKEAHLIKTRYGLGVSKKQAEITQALSPIMAQLTKEIKRMVRYYEERSTSGRKIDQVVTMGGGANMPGLAEALTNSLRLPVRICDPWQQVNLHKLQAPTTSEKSMYATAFGMGLINPREIFS